MEERFQEAAMIKSIKHHPQKAGTGGHEVHKGFVFKAFVFFVSFVVNRF